MKKSVRHLRILGTRGVPAQHGGFETFAQECALYMQKRGWKVTVYCQAAGDGPITEDTWHAIRRITIPVKQSGPLSTMIFDWRAIRHAGEEEGLVLCLGYNTALFNARLRLKGIPIIINMDGIEWKRNKWSKPAKIWLYLNEQAGLHLSDHLIADNPGIAEHLQGRFHRPPLTTIPYGAPFLENLPSGPLLQFGLIENDYLLLIARPEPENSILEIVQAFTARPRNHRLVILGNYSKNHAYQNRILDAANDHVLFCGAIYDQEIVAALRYHCLFYVHGHTVGGTNPSLVEAMGAGNAILAHGNKFNRWVTGPEAAQFFQNEAECLARMDNLLASPATIAHMKKASRKRFLEAFTWEKVLQAYETCFNRYLNENNHT
jgi:glycosyltransferase involved in cell wall biosynthesis